MKSGRKHPLGNDRLLGQTSEIAVEMCVTSDIDRQRRGLLQQTGLKPLIKPEFSHCGL